MPADIGPASHHPAPHYMAEEFDPDHMFRDLLNQAKDINPEAFAKHYHAAVLEQRQESAEYHSPLEREEQIDDLFGGLLDRLFDMWHSGPAGTFSHWTPAQEDDYVRDIASYCAALDILQETN
jgi:hypothetical protein